MDAVLYLVLIAAPLVIGALVAVSLVRGLWRLARRRAAAGARKRR
jgi:hypothetical protein